MKNVDTPPVADKKPRSSTQNARLVKKEKLAAALRDNLRRRKAAAVATSAEGELPGDGAL